ncbi:MAG: hypothetical protein LUC25_07055 [Ruminococcus sp.]|nr:hypothetical protein [Ruminococcus sp.]
MKAPGVGGSARNVCNCRCCMNQRARWALDEDELKRQQSRAEYFGLDKTKDFEDFKQKYLKASEDSDIILLDDIEIGRSIGAKAANYEIIDFETGEMFHFAEGTKIQNVEVFAGKGTKTEFRKAEKYANKYGGVAEDWQHAKGYGVVETLDGDRRAEVHWVQCQNIGKFDFFIKEWLD